MEVSGISLVKDGITITLASVGAVLGVMNTWRAINRDQPNLRVTFKHVMTAEGAYPSVRFCIEVLNLSPFSLTVAEVGVLYRGTDKRGVFVSPIIIDGGNWPRRLEPRSRVTAYIDASAFAGVTEYPLKCAYATTDCGATFQNRSGAFKQVAREQSRQSA